MAEQDPKQPESEMSESAAPEARDEHLANPEGAAPEAGAEEQVTEADVSPEEEMARLHEDLANARDAVLRAQAEAQNVKRRAEQDVEKARTVRPQPAPGHEHGGKHRSGAQYRDCGHAERLHAQRPPGASGHGDGE